MKKNSDSLDTLIDINILISLNISLNFSLYFIFYINLKPETWNSKLNCEVRIYKDNLIARKC